MTTPQSTSPDLTLAWRLADSLTVLAPPANRPLERLTANMLVAATIARASITRPELADSARAVARRSEGDAQIDPTRDLTFTGAFVHSLLGNRAETLRLLKVYVAANPHRRGSLKADPGWWFRDVASDPEFRRLVEG
jgi:hypothetical protein